MVDREERLSDRPQVEIRLGDAHVLSVDAATADRTRMDRALQHVADPVAVLAGLLRVLKPGGLLSM